MTRGLFAYRTTRLPLSLLSNGTDKGRGSVEWGNGPSDQGKILGGKVVNTNKINLAEHWEIP